MKTNLLSYIVLIFVASACQSIKPNQGKKTDTLISISSLLNEMVDRDAIAKYPKTNFKLKQESSYNRASKTIEDKKGWFNNKDYNNNQKDHNFIRVEENNGQKEWVLMDHKGAGAIVRTWMPFKNAKKPNTNIQIKIYLDGAKEPALEGNMLGLLNGTGLIPYPFAHKSLRSAVSFFPIPYAKSCKVTVTNRPFFYQFTYREYDEGTPIKTFTIEDFNQAKSKIEPVGKLLLSPKNDTEGKDVTLFETLKANEEKSVELPKGVAAIRALSLKLGSYQDSTITRDVIIKINFDDKQTVWCPISEFFGTGVGLNPFQGWYRTVAKDGTMSSRWVMPYQKTGTISIMNRSKKPIEIELNANIGDWKWDSSSMYFHAGYHQQYPVSTRPYSDWNYIEISGKGVYVGDALTIMNPVEKWWGEGDEKIWVDGEDFPSIFGTGTEDYYGYSWGGMSTDFYEHPFHAQPRSHIYNKLNRKKIVFEKNTKGFSTETRTRALDIMPFNSSLKLDMEVWHWKDCEMEFAVGTYWYGLPGAMSNRDTISMKDLK
ncbi:glycoside hydrolase family 172 protein [uncultured Polaribacter sp.]|uniref:glycoside hydrolase family 172 protein n=1 Tax=uncultured Polaribacter sp. TaxID=174711 RepID=UPI00263437E5|nr:glycoside hydrolase family 172 protein [uncultured Polaribacter sp.]